MKIACSFAKTRPGVSAGFTIVELLIVVVVIAILAAITLVSFNGITKRATQSSVQEALSQVNKKVLLYHAEQGTYPATLGDVGITGQSGSPFYNYVAEPNATPAWYQLTVSNGINGSEVYSISSTDSSIRTGAAQGSNIVAWDKSDNTTAPISTSTGVTIDTSVFRTSTASIRLPPGAANQRVVRVNPVTGTIGQIVRVSAWMKTDANWNGAAGNSKIRIATYPSGALLLGCSYDGAKTVWTYVSCTYPLSASNPSLTVQFGNDGSVGNVWLDDIAVSVR